MAIEVVQDSTPETFDALVAEVRRLKDQVGANLWRLGRCLGKLHDRPAWWKPKHRTWELFAAAEFNLSRGYALKLIDVSRQFTEHQAQTCGVTKLIRILSIPVEERPRFVRDAKTSSAAEVRASINRYQLDRAKATGGVVTSGRPERTFAAKTHRIAFIDPAEKIVALYAKGNRAKTVEHEPKGRVLLGGKAYVMQLRSTEQGLVIGVKLEEDES